MPNPYDQLRQNQINTASSEELTLMLYEGALKFCNQSILALENKDIEKCHDMNMRVQDIIMEFKLTLNHSYEISKNLDLLYDYIHSRLVEANMKKDKAILEEVRDFLRDFRDMWKEAMKLARINAAPKSPMFGI